VSDAEKKSVPIQSANKNKELVCKNCGKREHETKSCKSETVCFYCKATGHRKFEYPKADSKLMAQGLQPQGAQLAASVTEVEGAASQDGALGELVREGDDGTRRAESKSRSSASVKISVI